MKKLCLLLLSAFVLLSCTDDSDDTEFSVTLKVTDPNGDPVENLYCSIFDSNLFNENYVNDDITKSQTSILFILNESIHTEINVMDGRNNIIRTLVSEILDTGTRLVIWNGLNNDGEIVKNGPYTINMKTEKNGSVTYSASKMAYMMSFANENAQTRLSNGTVTIDNMSLFPSLNGMTSMDCLNSDGDCIGIVNFSSKHTVLLTNEDNTLYSTAEVTIENKANSFDIIWNPQELKHPKNDKRQPKVIGNDNGNVTPMQTELLGIFPNPFQ